AGVARVGFFFLAVGFGRARSRRGSSMRSRRWSPFAFEMSRSVTILPSRLDGRGAVFRGTATESLGSSYSLMGLRPNYGVRTCRNQRAEPFATVQPGTIAEKRPAVPPATTILMLSGE